MTLRKLHSFRTINSVAVVVVAAMLAAACGGDDDPAVSETPPDTTTTTTGVESTTPTATEAPVAEVDSAVAAADEIPDDIVEEILEAAQDASSPEAPPLVDCLKYLNGGDIELTPEQVDACAEPLVAAIETSNELLDPESVVESEYDPVLIVHPPTVPSVGDYSFTINGGGFLPGTTVYTLICTIPGARVSVETPVPKISAALGQITRSDCDISTAEGVDADASGSFSVQRSATIGENFAWVASNVTETQAAASPILLEELEPEDEVSPVTSVPVLEPEVPEPEGTVDETAEPDPAPESEQSEPDPEPVQEETAQDTTNEPESEQPQPAPSIEVDPSTVPWLGGYDFTITGSDFTPNSQVSLAVCTAPGAPLSPDTPAAELAAAMEQIVQSDCDLANAHPVTVGSDGSFATQTGGTVGAVNFVWVAGSGGTDAAAALVFVETLAYEPPEPEANQYGDWVPPQAGMVPTVFPTCEEPPYDETCLPPTAWERGEDIEVGVRVRGELPRKTDQIAEWTRWCYRTISPNASCDSLLSRMKWPLDYLGAHPLCVLPLYTGRVETYARSSSATHSSTAEQYGWQNCATVIDPLLPNPPQRDNDIGWRLSDTGISLADRCRAVLPEDVELEGGRPFVDFGVYGEPKRFGNDCDAWAADRGSRPRAETTPQCWFSALLAQEWLEHYYQMPEDYYYIGC